MKPNRTISAWLAALVLAAGFSLAPLAAQETPTAPPAPAAPAAVKEAHEVSEDPEDSNDTESASEDENEVVSVGRSEMVAKGKTASALVVVLGDGTVDGEVTEDVVVVGGTATIRGKVAGDVVNVGFGVKLEPGAEVGGDVVGIGGGVFRAAGAIVKGEIVPIGLSAIPGFREGVPEWIRTYLNDGLAQLRPLTFTVFAPWKLMAILFFLHFLVAALLPGASTGVERTIVERPGATALMAALSIPLGLFMFVLLGLTVVGPLLFIAGILVAELVGKVAVLQFLGGRLTGAFGAKASPPVLRFVVGAILAALLYATPFIGFFVWFALSLWGTGAVVLALFGRDESRKAPAPAPTAPGRPVAEPTGVRLATEVPIDPGLVPAGGPPVTAIPLMPEPPAQPLHGASSSTGFAQQEAPPSFGSSQTQFQSQSHGSSTAGASASSGFSSGTDRTGRAASDWMRGTSQPGLDAAEIESLPRPGFLPRFGALFLDWILVGMASAMVPDFVGPARLLVAIGYFAGFIAWRGTTLGGLLFRLQVVRLDGRPLDRATAIVRAVGAVLSGMICGLGWFWALWDPERQAWHDKFAGTVVLQVGKSKPLV